MTDTTQTIQPLIGTRHERESDAAVVACNDYLRMGPGRSLRELLQTYSKSTVEKPPTKNIQTAFDWSSRYAWQDRASAYDAEQDKTKTIMTAAARKASIESGLALDFERVEKLKALAADLELQIFMEDKTQDERSMARRPRLWMRDVKKIGNGEDTIYEEVFRYNNAIINDYRGVLDDLAKETGGRKLVQELTGKDGGALRVETFTGELEKVYGDSSPSTE